MAIQGNYAYISFSSFNEPAPLTVVDISEPVNPRIVSEQIVRSANIKLVAAGNFLYTMAENALTVMDISYPAVPRVVGIQGLSLDGNARSLLVGEDVLYLIFEDGISVLPLHAPER